MFRVSPLRRALFWCILAALATPSPASFADDGVEADLPGYLLSAGDVLEISVFAQTDLSRQYRIRSDGTISMHLMGSIPASDMTAEAFEASLEARLVDLLNGPVSATVEVVAYRPIAVLGYVTQSGLHPFSDGLDVTRALALAGGFPATETGATANAAMRVAEEEQQYQQLRADLAGLLTERARLLAEREGASEVAPVDQAIDLIGASKAEKLADEQNPADGRPSRTFRHPAQGAAGPEGTCRNSRPSHSPSGEI